MNWVNGQILLKVWPFSIGFGIAKTALYIDGCEPWLFDHLISSLFSENLVVSVFLFTSLVYRFIFIRDLDNPFEHSGRSAADADLSYLE
jgi:hypothetical protein